MQTLSAKLKSISFARNCESRKPMIDPEKWKLIKWIFPCAALMAACLSHIYKVPFIAVKSSSEVNPYLNTTLFDTYGDDLDRYQEPFCGLVWVKVVFFFGFAASHFSMGFLADYFGNWKMMKLATKALIVSGIGVTLSHNIYIFTVLWSILAYFATSSYLLLSGPILETTDRVTSNWKWRLVAGVLFQVSWTVGRLFCNFVVFVSETWVSVILVLTVILLLVYFIFEGNIWDPNFIKNTAEEQGDDNSRFWADLSASNTLYLNIMVLSLTWFTLGYNYYGMMNSWTIISAHKKMFEHNILASVLALISKICALILCYVSHRKCLPLMVLQFFTAICYFLLSAVDFDTKDSSNSGICVTFVVHMSTFLITASFGLVWVITPETFPKKYRSTCTGICSGAARLGAITGIIIGELKLLHSSFAVNALAGIVTLISALLIKVLPDMTKENMPVTSQDIEKVQFPEKITDISVPQVQQQSP